VLNPSIHFDQLSSERRCVQSFNNMQWHTVSQFFENGVDFVKNVRVYVTAEASSLRKYDPNFQLY